jgi:hypothetical protein
MSKITSIKVESEFITTDNSSLYQNNTFGTLVEAFFKKYMLPEDIISKNESQHNETNGEISFSSSFFASIDKKSRSDLKKQLNQIVSERNKLVHNFMLQISDTKNIKKSKEELDECYEKARLISDYITQVIESRNKSITYMLTDQFKLVFCYHEIFECLSKVYHTHKNSTDWCQFNLFITEINKQYKSLCDEVKSEYQFSSWSYFLDKLGFIELKSSRNHDKTVLYFRVIS